MTNEIKNEMKIDLAGALNEVRTQIDFDEIKKILNLTDGVTVVDIKLTTDYGFYQEHEVREIEVQYTYLMKKPFEAKVARTEHFFERNGMFERLGDWEGSSKWGRLDDGSFEYTALRAFSADANWLNKDGIGDF